jgi:hypothetical protein
MKRIATHLLSWLCMAGFWLMVLRAHHPTFTIAILATALLIASYAIAVYINQLLLIPRFQTWGFAYYLIVLAIVLFCLTVTGVLSIQAVYDFFWGPDRRCFGFWFNFTTDLCGMIIYVFGAWLICKSWIGRHFLNASSEINP